MRLLCVLAGLVLALAIPSRGHAAITYLTQQRFVSANGFVNGQPEGQADQIAPNFGPFDGLRERAFTDNVGFVRATQQSSLLADRVVFRASCQSEVNSIGVEFGIARSYLSVNFSISVPSAFAVLHSHLIDGSPGQKVATASLRGPAGFVFDWNHSHADPNTWAQSPFSGMLAAGQYQLVVDTFTTRGSNPPNIGITRSNVDFELLVPSPSTLSCAFVAILAIRGRPARGTVVV